LFALPLAAGNAWQALQNADVYSYETTPQSRGETRRALEQAAASVMPESAERKSFWSGLIQREIDEGDFVAARGFLLSARTMLPPEDAARLNAQLGDADNDKAREKFALIFVDDAVRRQYQSGASPLASAPGQSNFSVLGDMTDISTQSARWLAGEPVDVFILSLSGAGVALAADDKNSAVRAGASVVKTAKRSGKLSAAFSNHIERLVRAALPPQQLKQALEKGFSNAKPGDEPAAVAKAFQASVDPAGFKALEAQLADIKALADAVGPSGAVQLLSQAEDAKDVTRLRLIAEAGGARSVAVAKRAPARLLESAKGALQLSNRLMIDIGLFIGALVVIALSFLITLGGALLAEWRHGHQDEDEDEEDYARA
jgi:hypothetical protein